MVVGSVNADLVLQVGRLPKEGETLGAHTLKTFPGGKAWAIPYLPPSMQGTPLQAGLGSFSKCGTVLCGRAQTRRRQQRGCSIPRSSLAR